MTTIAVKKIGRYEVLGELGRGAMGVVYKAMDPTIGRTVALKTLRLDIHGAESGDLMRRFQNEARAAGTLNHPNIVTIYDAGDDDGVFYIAMEYLEGTTLHELLAERGVLEPGQIVRISREICKGLDYAQAHGIVHRDIKPANIMITSRGAVKIMDFGIAKVGGSLTSTGQVLGTPNYMSPEQVKGKQLDGRSDLFSFGVILYEMLTGEKPFAGQNVTTIIYKIVNETPIAPRELDASIHASLNATAMKALAKLPEERYQSGAELVRDLENFQESDTSRSTAAQQRSTVAEKTVALPVTPLREISHRETAAATARTPPRPAPAIKKNHRGALIGVMIAVFAVAALAASYGYYRSRAQVQQLQATIRKDEAQAAKPEVQPSATPMSTPAPASVALATPEATEGPAPIPPAIVKTPSDERPQSKPRHSPAPVPPADLNIASQPAGAKVSIDGQNDLNWVTPFKASRLAPGKHILVFSKDGYDAETRSVDALAGKTVSFSVDLTAVFKVSIGSNPAGASILVDGEDSGQVTPAQLTLEKRQHRITVRKAGYKDVSAETNPWAGPFNFAPVLLSTNQSSEDGPSTNFLRRFVGTDAIPDGKGLVHIRTVPEGATIVVNGRVAPRKTNARWPAEPGVYSIDLILRGYKTVHRNVQVEQGKIKNIDEILEKQ